MYDPNSDKNKTFDDNYSKISEDDADSCHHIINSVYSIVTDFYSKNVKFCDMHFIKYIGGFRLMVFVDVNNQSFHIKFEEYKIPDP